MCLEFGEGHLHGVEIRTVARQKQEPDARSRRHCAARALFVDGEIGKDDEVAPGKGRRELGVEGRRLIALSITQGAVMPWQRSRR